MGQELLAQSLAPFATEPHSPQRPAATPPTSGREKDSLGQQFNKLGSRRIRGSVLVDIEVWWELIHRHVTSGDDTGPSCQRPGVWLLPGQGFFLFKSFRRELPGLGGSPCGRCAHRWFSLRGQWLVTCQVRTCAPPRVACSQAAHFSFTALNLPGFLSWFTFQRKEGSLAVDTGTSVTRETPTFQHARLSHGCACHVSLTPGPRGSLTRSRPGARAALHAPRMERAGGGGRLLAHFICVLGNRHRIVHSAATDRAYCAPDQVLPAQRRLNAPQSPCFLTS